MQCKLSFIPEVFQDIAQLPIELQKECLDTLDKLSKNIHLGKALENKNGRDLSGYYKLYFNEAKHRIVYKKYQEQIKIESISSVEHIAQIYGIGKRQNEEIYKIVDQRIKNR